MHMFIDFGGNLHSYVYSRAFVFQILQSSLVSSISQCSIFHLNVTNCVKITKIWPEKKSQFFLILGAIQCQRGTYMVISFNSNTYLSKSIASYSSFFKNRLIFEVHQKQLNSKDPTSGLDPLAKLMYFWSLNQNLCLVFTRNHSFSLKITFSISETEEYNENLLLSQNLSITKKSTVLTLSF